MSDKRLFFALWPDDRQRERLRDTAGPAIRQVEGDAVPRANWHVTVRFIGNFPAERVAALQAAAAEVRTDPFRLRFDRLGYWQRPRIACLEAASVPRALETLVGRLEDLVRAFDCPPEERAYRPHITLLRRARPFEPLPLARPLELEWADFALVESVSRPGGVEYRPLKQALPDDS